MKIYAVLARLLDYPRQELKENLALAREIIVSDPNLSDCERGRILATVDWMQAGELLDLQAAYTQTFDITPENSLHLTHHSFGDNRERGPALVDLGEHYKAHGLAAKEGELPDYLPLMLEYASTLDPFQAGFFLNEATKIVAQIAANLERIDSPYAPLLRFIEGRGRIANAA